MNPVTGGLFKPYESGKNGSSSSTTIMSNSGPRDGLSAHPGFRSTDEGLSDSSDGTETCPTSLPWSFNLSLPSAPSFTSFPNLPSIGTPNFIKNSTLTQNMGIPNISDYLPSPTNYLPNISQHMPRMSIPSMPSIPSFIPSMPSLPNFINYKQNKSWSDLKESVRIAHRRLSEVSNRVPFAFSFSPIEVDSGVDGKNKITGVRLYFLSPAHNSPETTLHYCDVYDVDDSPNFLPNSASLSSLEEPLDETMTSSQESLDRPAAPMSFSSSVSSSSQAFTSHHHHLQQLHANQKPRCFEWKSLIESTAVKKSKDPTTTGESSSITTSTSCEVDKKDKTGIEEKLLLERKRMMLSGITSYEFDNNSRRFVFSSGQSLYYFDDDSIDTDKSSCDRTSNRNRRPPFEPLKIPTQVHAYKMNPQINPWNPDLIAFVSEGNLYVSNVASEQEVRLTDVSSREAVTAGLPSYVIQEEFRRYGGLWWRPNPSDDPECHEVSYSILYEEVDESMVDIVRITSYDGTAEEYRFPRPGDPNAISLLKMTTFKYDKKTKSIFNPDSVFQSQDLPDLKSVSPDCEYVVRVGWLSKDVYWVQTLNRKQTRLDLSLFSVNNDFPSQVIWSEVADKYWVNVADVLVFLENDKETKVIVGSVVKFIWTSEESGFRHLYRIEVEIVSDLSDQPSLHETPLPSNDNSDASMDGVQEQQRNDRKGILVSKCVSKTQLTSGDWEVSDKDVWVDENRELVYFMATKEIAIEKHLYVVSYNTSDENGSLTSNPIKRLSDSGFYHSCVAFDSSHSFFVNIQSNISMPPFGYIHKIRDDSDTCPSPEGSRSRRLRTCSAPRLVSEGTSPKRRITDLPSFSLPKNQENLPEEDSLKASTSQLSTSLPRFRKLGLIAENSLLSTMEVPPPMTTNASLSLINDQVDLLPGLPKPELFTHTLKSGDLVYGVIFKPDFMENGMKYPCLLDIYGGPEVQVVTNSFKGMRHVRRHLFASEGYVVVALDCRGSHHRGRDFAGHIYHKMGQLEIADQVEVLTWLAETTGYIDMKKIAIHGFSYGGYLSLMALAQRPDVFKVAIAGAPVTKWSLYDTGYTERYMDTPFNNPDGYNLGSVLSYIGNFPDQENRLLIIHGLMDENVHFIHSAELINALVKAGKPYQLQVSLNKHKNYVNFLLMTNFFLQVYPSERHSLRNSSCCEHYETYLLSYLQRHLLNDF